MNFRKMRPCTAGDLLHKRAGKMNKGNEMFATAGEKVLL